MKAVYICFIYAIHIFIVYWLVKRFLEKSRNFIVSIIMITLIAFWLMYPACSMRAKRRVYSARACVIHKRAITAWIIYALKKTIYGLKKTVTAWKDYLRVEKDYLRLWPSFFRIVSLFLITWRTFNQSMDKNIWMPYIILNIGGKSPVGVCKRVEALQFFSCFQNNSYRMIQKGWNVDLVDISSVWQFIWQQLRTVSLVYHLSI